MLILSVLLKRINWWIVKLRYSLDLYLNHIHFVSFSTTFNKITKKSSVVLFVIQRLT